MEAKTMGSFLAALRKAAGMTQRELAERLHVSDKAVSRWERDECAPDLALLPVIAEIFSVSCNELLRGGRAKLAQPDDPAKAEKQRQWILEKTRARYRGRTLLALLGPTLGAVAAAASVLAFGQAVLGFWLGAAGCLVGTAIQLFLWNGAVLSLSGDQAGDEAAPCRYELLRITELSLLLCTAALAALLPLNWYTPGDWLLLSQVVRPMPYAPLAAVCCGAVVLLGLLLLRVLNPWLARRAPISLPEDAAQAVVRRARSRSRAALALAAALSATALLQGAATLIWPTAALARGTVYDNAADFRAAMAADDPAPETPLTTQQLTALLQRLEEDQIIQYNSAQQGRGHLYNPGGEETYSYSTRNQAVAFLRYTPQAQGNFPAVEVVTVAQAQAALHQTALRRGCFLALYALELAAALVWSLARRRRAA